MEKKEMTISLPGINRPAIIRLCRAGQVSPDRGDEVRVRWQLMLPATRQKRLIAPLQYRYRIKPVAGNALTPDWGDGWDRRRRYVWRYGCTSAPKWADAFRLAEEYTLGEVGKLVKALEARQRALEAAE